MHQGQPVNEHTFKTSCANFRPNYTEFDLRLWPVVLWCVRLRLFKACVLEEYTFSNIRILFSKNFVLNVLFFLQDLSRITMPGVSKFLNSIQYFSHAQGIVPKFAFC